MSKVEEHDLNTCPMPICKQTRAIIAARGAEQRTPKSWNVRGGPRKPRARKLR